MVIAVWQGDAYLLPCVIFCLETCSGLKATEDCFQRCLISHDYLDLRFSYRRLSRLLELVGQQRKALMFQRLCNTDEVISRLMGIQSLQTVKAMIFVQQGYKTRTLKSKYMNLMVALDCATRMPVSSRGFPGYMLDKKEFLDFMGDVGPKGQSDSCEHGALSYWELGLHQRRRCLLRHTDWNEIKRL